MVLVFITFRLIGKIIKSKVNRSSPAHREVGGGQGAETKPGGLLREQAGFQGQ